MIIWAPDPAAKDPCLRVQTDHGREARPNDVALVMIGEAPMQVAGPLLPDDDWKKVERFVHVNRKVLLAYLRGSCDSSELVRRLVRV